MKVRRTSREGINKYFPTPPRGAHQTDKPTKSETTIIEPRESPFLEEVRKFEEAQTRMVLDELLKSIDEQGKLFLQAPVYENLLRYRQLVQAFMKEALDNLYKVKEKMGRRISPQQRKVYVLVEGINQNLAELTQEVLKAQADPITLAAKLDEIRGMLVDLYT